MAIDTWLSATIDPGATKKPDQADHVHSIFRSTTNAGDVTVAFDKTKVSKRVVLRSAVLQILKALEGGSELT